MYEYGKIICSGISKDGKIYTGKTHSDCFRKAPKGYLRNGIQGFVTEDNQFVDRFTALEIAEYYNQIVKKHPPYDQLMSEDMLEDVIIDKEVE